MAGFTLRGFRRLAAQQTHGPPPTLILCKVHYKSRGTQLQAPSIPHFLAFPIPPGLLHAQGPTEIPGLCALPAVAGDSITQIPQLSREQNPHPPPPTPGARPRPLVISPPGPTILTCPRPTSKKSAMAAAKPVRRRALAPRNFHLGRHRSTVPAARRPLAPSPSCLTLKLLAGLILEPTSQIQVAGKLRAERTRPPQMVSALLTEHGRQCACPATVAQGNEHAHCSLPAMSMRAELGTCRVG